MHERSLVRSLLRQVEQIAAEHHAEQVTEVTVEIGPLSGVEIELVRSAFDQLAGEMRLIIIEAALQIQCLQCDQVSELPGFVFRCRHCDSGRVKVIAGDDFRLVSLTLAEGAVHGR